MYLKEKECKWGITRGISNTFIYIKRVNSREEVY